jgi:uncharacterized DUF497 family protein
VEFEWDKSKAQQNLRKHGVTFEEAATVFNDSRIIIRLDDEHSIDEERWQAVGLSEKGRMLIVIHIERRENVTRLISARRALQREAVDYGKD